jgi:pectin methylesterase-like acyl-CoA thioesterase
MRPIQTYLLSILLLLAMPPAKGQTTLFSEDFESNSLPDSVTTSGTSSWAKSSTLFAGGVYSDSAAIINPGDSAVLTTLTFSTSGFHHVVLYFDHICKIEFFDEAYIEVSNNNGQTWTRLTGIHYLGASQFSNQSNKFSAASYGIDWAAGQAAIPDNSWWRGEVFNLTLVAANASQVKVRFVLKDALPGNFLPDNYGWFLDNIRVEGMYSETTPPAISLIPPVAEDTLITSTPYVIMAAISDFSGIDTAMVLFSTSTGFSDTLGMTEVSQGIYSCTIPFFGYGITIYWKILAVDQSPASNEGYFPLSGSKMIYALYNQSYAVEIGSGSTGSSSGGPTYIGATTSPLGNSHHISLFTKNEINTIGKIKSIAWFKHDQQGYLPGDGTFRIFLKNTTSNALATTAGTFANEVSGATLVYESFTQSLPTDTGWLEFTIPDPNLFQYDSTQNLMVLVEWHKPGLQTGPVSWRYSSAASKACTWAGATMPPVSTFGIGIRPNIKLTFIQPSTLATDAGIAQIVSPAGPVVANAPFNVIVSVKNWGVDTLSNAVINWSVDGVLQSPVMFTGALLQDSISSPVLIGSLSLSAGFHLLKVWSDQPNNLTDLNHGNDTSKFSITACAGPMNGNYTIGASNADFPNFSDALLTLVQCGINAPVTFHVQPGIYQESLQIHSIPGASSVNTIVFQSISSDSNDVVLQNLAAGSSSNFTLGFDGASWITFRKMTIRSLNPLFGRAISISGNISNITLENNVLESPLMPPASGNGTGAVVFASGSQMPGLIIRNNLILRGEHGVYLVSDSISKTPGTIISGNIMSEQTQSAIQCHYFYAPEITSNLIRNLQPATEFQGIVIKGTDGDLKILCNEITIQHSIASQAISLDKCFADVMAPGLIANNMASVQLNLTAIPSFTPSGICIQNSSYQQVFYNSVHLFGASNQTTASLKIAGGSQSTGIKLINNILSNQITAGAALLADGIQLNSLESDYNIFNISSGTIAVFASTFPSLAGWQQFSGQDAHSHTIIPWFLSDTNLHTFNSVLNGLALPLSVVTTDIDGDLRDALAPDPGADELQPRTIDLTIFAVTSPVGGCALTSGEAVTIRIRNNGTDTISTPFNTGFRVLHDTSTVQEIVTTQINPGDTLDFTFSTTVDLNVSGFGGSDSTFLLQCWVAITGDQVPLNDSIIHAVESKYTPPAPTVTSPIAIPYGSSATLNAISAFPTEWFTSDTSQTPVHLGITYTTPLLYTSTAYWVHNLPGSGISGPNVALNAAVSQSGGGTGAFSAANYNDDVIPPYGTPPSGWVSTNGWIEYLWPNSVTISSVKFYKDNRPMSTCTFQYWDGFVWVNFLNYYNVVIEDSVSFPAITTNKLRFFNIFGNNNPNFREIQVFAQVDPGCPSFRIPLVVNVGAPPQIDAGILSVINPGTTTPAGITTPVIVELKNFGTDTLHTAQISWSLNNVLQTPYSWIGSLPTGTSTQVTIGTSTFPGGTNCIKAWTSMPNFQVDFVNSNDTATRCFNACLSGNYTIGPTPGSFHFNTFNAAINAIISYGICGDVIFNVSPGIYTEQLTINQIVGMNPSNTITFRGVTGDSTNVVLQYSASGVADNWVVRLNSASYFTFQAMTIRALGVDYGNVLEFKDGANHNTVTNCGINTSTKNSSSFLAIYSGANNPSNDVTIKNNRIIGGYSAISWAGSTSLRKNKLQILENIIEGFSAIGINANYADSFKIVGNTIQNASGATSVMAIYSGYSNLFSEISRNTITANQCTSFSGIYIASKPASPSEPILIANNMIVTNGTGLTSPNGIYILNAHHLQILYNSVWLSTGGILGKCINYASGSIMHCYNNALSNTSGGYTLYCASTTGIASSDFNALYTSGSFLARWGTSDIASFASWKTISGFETNSHNIHPPFITTNNLHLANSSLSGKATPIQNITVDLDGDPRSIYPAIGADEYPLPAIDAGVVAITSPMTSMIEGQTYPVHVVIKNFGTDTISGFHIDYFLNNGTPVSQFISDTIAPFDTLGVQLQTIIAPPGQNTLCAYTLLPADASPFNDELCITLTGHPLHDLEVTRIAGLHDGCGLGTDSIRIWVKNNGLNGVNTPSSSQAFAHYQVNGILPFVTSPVTSIIQPNDSVLFVFPTPVQFSVPGGDSTFNISSWVSMPGDNLPVNDTAFFTVVSSSNPANPVIADTTIPYSSFVTLEAQSSDLIKWYHSSTDTTAIATGNQFTTPVLTATTTFWVEPTRSNLTRGPIPELIYYRFDTLGTSVWNEALTPVGNNPALITGSNMTIGNAGMTGYALVGTGLASTTGVINTGWPISLTGSFSFSFWTSNINPGSSIRYLFGCDGNSFRCFTNGAAGANNWLVTGGGLPNLMIPGAVTTNPAIVHVVYNAAASTYKGYLNGILTTTVAAPASNTINGTGFQFGGFGLNSNVPGLIDEFRFYSRALTQAEIDTTWNTTLSRNLCIGSRIPVTVTVLPPKPCDVGVTAMLSPTSAVFMDSTETFTVRISNLGTSPQTTIPVSYQINNQAAVHEIANTSIQPNGYFDYTFSAKADFSQSGMVYQVKVWTDLSCDTIPVNDTLLIPVTHLSPVYCISTATNSAYQDITQVSVANMTHSSVAVGSLYTDQTTAAPIPVLVKGSKSMMAIGSGLPPGYTIPQNCRVKVWIDLNRNGSFDTINEMVFNYATNSSNLVVDSIYIPSSASSGLTYMRVVLQGTTNPALVFPCGTYTFGETEDYLVRITDPVTHDITITSLNYPTNDTAIGSMVHVSVSIANLSVLPHTQFPVTLTLNNQPVITDIYTGVIQPGDTLVHQFSIPFMVPASSYQLCAFTDLTGDSDKQNDTICKGFGVLPAHHDVGVTAIVQPLPDLTGNICTYSSSAPWYQFPLIVRIQNFGQQMQIAIPIGFSFATGGPVQTDLYVGSLAANDSVDVPLYQPFLPNVGWQTVCIETLLSLDAVPGNNKTCLQYFGVVCTSVEELPDDALLLLGMSPNPASSQTSLRFSLPADAIVNYGCMSPTGQVVLTGRYQGHTGINMVDFDLTTLDAGMYLCFIEVNKQRFIQKLIKL